MASAQESPQQSTPALLEALLAVIMRAAPAACAAAPHQQQEAQAKSAPALVPKTPSPPPQQYQQESTQQPPSTPEAHKQDLFQQQQQLGHGLLSLALESITRQGGSLVNRSGSASSNSSSPAEGFCADWATAASQGVRKSLSAGNPNPALATPRDAPGQSWCAADTSLRSPPVDKDAAKTVLGLCGQDKEAAEKLLLACCSSEGAGPGRGQDLQNLLVLLSLVPAVKAEQAETPRSSVTPEQEEQHKAMLANNGGGKKRKSSPDSAFRGRGPWTEDEDKELLAYVDKHGAANWRNASRVTRLRRDAQSCRLRWHSYLSPNVNKTPFTPEEDKMLLETITWNSETKWSAVAAEKFPDRTGYQIQRRWHVLVKREQKHQFQGLMEEYRRAERGSQGQPSEVQKAAALTCSTPAFNRQRDVECFTSPNACTLQNSNSLEEATSVHESSGGDGAHCGLVPGAGVPEVEASSMTAHSPTGTSDKSSCSQGGSPHKEPPAKKLRAAPFMDAQFQRIDCSFAQGFDSCLESWTQIDSGVESNDASSCDLGACTLHVDLSLRL